ncbi:CPBP family intramembrane glutamic endopeptidase [Mangrovimonas sp. TPBH4]|uniref:CPBP family intramembrane glutamic endopeptidase n=1 Tax=Mangrovimonas sp. TPBH4 TaxID=1645914 RepID=UPI0018D00792|nr:CPBP family intramembrane glutamic endopeptidase [Mangrovimonas sp. TPBH4]
MDFEAIGKGILIDKSIFISMISVFTVPFIISFLPWNNSVPKDMVNVKELMGAPIEKLPSSIKELWLFFGFIVVGVVFEELICRQFLFFAINKTLGLGGDLLVIVTAILFSIGHWYQGWKGVLGTLVLGLVFGKALLVTENIMVPIILHFLNNLTVVHLSYKRIKAIKQAS